MTRFCSRRVAADCAPVTPSIRGSMTSVTFCEPSSSLAFENRSFAAFNSAASNGTGVGGGGGRRRRHGRAALGLHLRHSADKARAAQQCTKKNVSENISENVAKIRSDSHS